MVKEIKAKVAQHGGKIVDDRSGNMKAEFADSFDARSFYYSMLKFNNVVEMTFPTPDRVQVHFPKDFTRATPSRIEGAAPIAATL